MEDILVIYNTDAADCSTYILNYFAREEYHLRTSSLLDSTLLEPLDRPATKVKVLILILSVGHLDFLRNCTARFAYEDQIRSAGSTLIYLYGLGSEEDVENEGISMDSGKELRNRMIPGYKELQKFTYEQHSELLTTTMIKVEGLDTPEEVAQGPRTGQKKAGRKTSKRTQDRRFRVIPKTARCEASTAMIISLCDTMDEKEGNGLDTEKKEEEAHVEEELRKGMAGKDTLDVVTVAFGSDNPEQQIVLPTERINRNTHLFFAPEHSEGIVPIHIIVNGDVIGHSAIVYQSLQADLVLAVSQVYMFLLNRLLGLLQESGQLSSEVDRRLCGLLEDDEANSIPIQAFEQLFSLSAACKGRSDCELPTLLHLAAKYDLADFASKLKDLPDAEVAAELRNHLGQTPDELTRSRESRGSPNQASNVNKTQNVKAYEEGVYEKFSPLEDDQHYSSLPDRDAASQSGKKYEEEDPYMVIPSAGNENETEPRRSVIHPTFPELPTDKKDEGVQSPSVVSAKQDELVSIQQQFKSNQLTISEAELLFKDWQLRNSTSELCSSKTSRLSGTAAPPIQKSVKASIVERLFKKSKSSPKQSKTSHLLSPTSPSIPEEQYPPPSHPTSFDPYSASSPRTSIASSSSRDSCMSKGSTSGIETVDEEEYEDEPTAYQTTVTSFAQRKSSANLEQLEEELRRPNAPRPPPPPPRRPAIKPSSAGSDNVEYLSMEGAYNRPSPSGGQGRSGPPVGPRTRKMSCPVAPQCAAFNRQLSSSGQTFQDSSPGADEGAKHSPGNFSRPSSIEVESVRSVPLPARKMSLPNCRLPENSARGRPLPSIKK